MKIISTVFFASLFVVGLTACDGGGGGSDDANTVRQAYYSTPQEVHPTMRFVDLQTSGFGSVCGITDAGIAWCWGHNGHGELGTQTPMETCSSSPCTGNPQRVETELHFVSLNSGSNGVDFHCGLLASGEAYCWGFGLGGQLGNGESSDSHIPVAVGGGIKFESINSGFYGTCGRKLEGDVYCWGAGVSDTLASQLTPYADFDLGENHVCALTESGEAFCWGDNWYGQSTGEEPGATEGIGTVLKPRLVAGVSGLISIVAGGDTSCGLDTAGQAYCWGSNTGTNLQEGSDVGPYPVDGEHVFASLHAGLQHICGLTIDGDAFCWGIGIGGNLGSGSESTSRVPIRVSVDIRFAKLSYWPNCGLAENGGAYCWGSNAWGQIGRPPYFADP